MSVNASDVAPPPPAVPGLQLLSLLRFSRSGETWLARDPSGAGCAVTLVPAALLSSAEPLMRLRHEHVLPVEDVVAAGRHVALRTPVPPQATLASLCAVRPALDPGEVVTLGVPISQALAAAHDRGLMHGDLDPADICLDDAGRPILTGIGLSGLAGHAAAPADDVLSLAMILRALLGDDAGPRAEAIRGVLGDALSGQAAGRPSAGELGQRLGLACPAQPLRWPRAAAPVTSAAIPGGARAGRVRAGRVRAGSARAGGARAGGGRRRAAVGPGPLMATARAALLSRLPGTLPVPGRVALSAILAVAGLALLLVVAPMLGKGSAPAPASSGDNVSDFLDASPDTMGPSPATATPAVSPSAATTGQTATSTASSTSSVPPAAASTPDWTGITRRIAAARDAVFSGLPHSGLTAADAPGSQAASVDAAKLASLHGAAVHARGLTTSIRQVLAQQAGADVAVLKLQEQTSAYDLVTSTGVLLEHRQASAATTWTVTVVRTSSGWRTATATSG